MHPDKKKSNLFNALLYSSESLSALLFSLVSIALIARHFGPQEMARYNVAQSVSTICVVVATLGLEQFIVREMARNPGNATFASSTLAGMLLGWLAHLLIMLAYYAAVGDLQRDLILVLCLAMASLFLRVLFVKAFLQATNDPQPIAVAALLSRLAAVAYLVLGSRWDYTFDHMMLYLPLQAAAMLAIMLLMRPRWLALIRPRHVDLDCLLGHLREAWPMFVASGLYFFYSQSDIILMSSLLDANTVGVYAAAIRLVPLASFIGFSLLATFYKEMDRRLAHEPDSFDTYVRSVLAVHFTAGLLLALGATLCADWAIHLLYGPRFQQSATVLKVACWAWLFMMPAALLSRLLVMLKLARYELIKMLLVAPAMVALNYLAISRIGILGAAAMSVLAYMAVDLAVYAVFKDTRQLARLGLGAIIDVCTRPIQTTRRSLALLKARH